MTPRINLQDIPKGMMDCLMKTGAYIRSTNLDRKLTTLIEYRVSQINSCAFCLDMHHKEAIHMGESESRLHGLAAWREFDYYTDKERAALAFAEVLTNANHQDVDEQTYAALEAVFTKEEIIHLTLEITMINTWNRLNKTFKTKPGYYKVGQY